MSKWFTLEVRVIKTYVVEVEDFGCAQDAIEYVFDEFAGANIEIEGPLLLLDDEIENEKMCADEVCPL